MGSDELSTREQIRLTLQRLARIEQQPDDVMAKAKTARARAMAAKDSAGRAWDGALARHVVARVAKRYLLEGVISGADERTIEIAEIILKRHKLLGVVWPLWAVCGMLLG